MQTGNYCFRNILSTVAATIFPGLWGPSGAIYIHFVYIVSFLSANWCQHWFEFFPNPPVNILGMVENVLVHHDKRLMQHFVSCNVTSQVRPLHNMYSCSRIFLTKSHRFAAGLAQSVERLTAKREIAGSIPGAGPILTVLK